MTIRNTAKYRITADKWTRRVEIQAAGTWAPVSTLTIPDEPGIIAALLEAIRELDGETRRPAEPANQSDQRERTTGRNDDGKNRPPLLADAAKPRGKKTK